MNQLPDLRATRNITSDQLRDIKQKGHARIVDTRWALTWTPDGSAKARLVVPGCQEPVHQLRSDAPTASLLAFNLVACFACQRGWTSASFDAQSAYLQSHGIERLLLLRLPHKNPPPGTAPDQVVIANGAIYGTRDAGRAWYLHAEKEHGVEGFHESTLEKGLYSLRQRGNTIAVAHTHARRRHLPGLAGGLRCRRQHRAPLQEAEAQAENRGV